MAPLEPSLQQRSGAGGQIASGRGSARPRSNVRASQNKQYMGPIPRIQAPTVAKTDYKLNPKSDAM
jgi:hypothetical protein